MTISLEQQFKEMFGFKPPLSEVAIISKGISLDLFKLEELLQAKDPSFNLDDYEQASLFRYIKEKYGKKSIGIINKLLKLKQ